MNNADGNNKTRHRTLTHKNKGHPMYAKVIVMLTGDDNARLCKAINLLLIAENKPTGEQL